MDARGEWGTRESDLGKGTSAIGTGPMPGGKARVKLGTLVCVRVWWRSGQDEAAADGEGGGAEMADRVVVTERQSADRRRGAIIEEIQVGIGSARRVEP